MPFLSKHSLGVFYVASKDLTEMLENYFVDGHFVLDSDSKSGSELSESDNPDSGVILKKS